MADNKDIYVDQAALGTTIHKLVTNMTKDSESRKNSGYIETREKNLKEIWEKFKSQHKNIMKSMPYG